MNFLPFHIIAVQPELFLMAELSLYIITQEGITWISRRSEFSLLQPLSRILGVGVNDLLSGEIIPEEKVREKSERNIMNVADMASLKYLGSIRTGMAGLLSLFVLLLIYCGVKGLEATGLMALICTFNGFFYCSRYRTMRSQQLLAFGIVWILTAVVNLIAFFMRTW